MKYSASLVLLGIFLAVDTAAAVELHALFSDHCVLQRDQAIPVWGTAEPGEAVKVTLGGRSAETKADQNGAWKVALKALPAGGPHVLQVSGKNEVKVEDVYLGEVWLCSGQSNMAWTVSRSNQAKEEMASAKHPQIRMFTVGRKPSDKPLDSVSGNWQVCSPDTVGRFSATAYFFGRELHQKLDVPVGLINSSVGGTPIEAWTSRPALEALFARDEVKKVMTLDDAEKSLGKGVSVLYNGMIAPLVPYGIRGAIWYQGERNRRIVPAAYRYLLPAMIADWRKQWGQGEFPFYFVQLPNFQKPQQQPSETTGWVLVRDGMFRSQQVNNAGMAVTIDIGEANNIHPKNKQDVGQRLARLALANTYDKDVVASGPIYRAMSRQDGKIVLKFDHVGGGLVAKGNEVKGFAVAGEDRKFVWAEAKIVGDTVEVSSPDIPQPAAVRYAWADNPVISLYNQAGLPAAPFRTDDWPAQP